MPRLSMTPVFLREWLGDRALPREPEPALVMDDPEQTRAYNEAASIDGVMAAYRAGEPGVTRALAGMRDLAIPMIAALNAADIDQLAALVDEHWRHQRALHPRITTAGIERVLELAREAGALGGKALGASGGGSVLVIAPDGMGARVRDAVATAGEVLDFRIDESGATVERSA